MTRPSMAIAMATYNGAEFLGTQLRSFLDQTRLPDQLVVSDDGSSDNTMSILKDFASTAPFDVRIVSNSENLGHEQNFSRAIDLVEADIILLSDQDDRWDPDKLGTVEREFACHPDTLLIVNDVRMADGGLEPIGRTLLGQLRSSGLIGRDNRGLLIGCGTSFRGVFKQLACPVPALGYGHDTWVNEFASMLGAKRIIERPLQDYRRHETNASFTAMDGAKRATPWTILRPSLGLDLTAAWETRLAALDEMHRRLSRLDDRAYSRLAIGPSQRESLDEIEAARSALNRRMNMFQRGWLGRKLLALAMLLAGEYRHFSGLRSFAKDLIR